MITALMREPCLQRSPSTCSERGSSASTLPRSTSTLLRTAGLLDDPVTTSPCGRRTPRTASRALPRGSAAGSPASPSSRRCGRSPPESHRLADDLVLRDLVPVELELVVDDPACAASLRSPPRCARAPRSRASRASLSKRASRSVGCRWRRRGTRLRRRAPPSRGGSARRLLVGGEQASSRARDQPPGLDALLPLELADVFDDLPAHDSRPSSIRFPRTISLVRDFERPELFTER